jgi:hypothetical protein
VTDKDRPLGDAVVVLGDDDAGCLAWDPDTDRLYHFEMDDGAAEPLPDKSLHDFFERVFDPERAVGPAAAEWATALRWLEVNA